MSLLIIKAKPNPAGKDRIGTTFTPAAQLAGEWVDFKNMGYRAIDLAGVEMYHWAYLTPTTGEWKLVTNFHGVLQPGQVIRVHSGNPIPLYQMHSVDQVGANFHLFSGKNYIWNNSKKDFPRLWYKPTSQWLDQTEYSAYPGEGRILNRVNSQLI